MADKLTSALSNINLLRQFPTPCKNCRKLLDNAVNELGKKNGKSVVNVPFSGECTCLEDLINEVKTDVRLQTSKFRIHVAPKFNGPDKVVYKTDINDIATELVALERTFRGDEKIPFKRRINDPISDIYDKTFDGVIDAVNIKPLIPYYRPKKRETVYFTLTQDKISSFCMHKIVHEVILPDSPRCMFFNIYFDKFECMDRKRIVDMLTNEIRMQAIDFGFPKNRVDSSVVCLNDETGYYVLVFRNIGFVNIDVQKKFERYLVKNCKDSFSMLLDLVLFSKIDTRLLPLLFYAIEYDRKKIDATELMVSDCFINGCYLYTGD